MIRLPAQQPCAEDHRPDKLNSDNAHWRLVGGAADSENKETEADRRQQRTGKVEGVGRARRLRQRLDADQHRSHTEWNVDREQPRPRCDRQDARSERRAERERCCDHQRIVAEAASMKP